MNILCKFCWSFKWLLLLFYITTLQKDFIQKSNYITNLTNINCTLLKRRPRNNTVECASGGSWTVFSRVARKAGIADNCSWDKATILDICESYEDDDDVDSKSDEESWSSTCNQCWPVIKAATQPTNSCVIFCECNWFANK